MKYPITPDYIKALPDPLCSIYETLGYWILKDICQRLKNADSMTATAIEKIRELQRRGYSYDDIRNVINRVLRLSDAEYKRLVDKVIDDNKKYYGTLFTEKTLFNEVMNTYAMQKEIDAIISQCKGNLNNITGSLGFCMKSGGKVQFLPIAKAYQRILSDADMRIWSGAQSYNEAIRDSVKDLADSGVRSVTWAADGTVYHVDHADVAVRRALMTGITQISSKYSEQARTEVPTEYMEITAHIGARDVDVPGKPWCNHKEWQGKVYSVNSGDKYPNVYDVCGWGKVDGLEGANCRHMHYPFWDGISERTYTDEQLKNIDPPDFEYAGKKYNAYQATQRQREIERALRKVKRELLAFDAVGDNESYLTSAVKYQKLIELYKDFSKSAGLTSQIERGNIAEFGPDEVKKVEMALKAL